MSTEKGRSFENVIAKQTRDALLARLKAAWNKAMKKLDAKDQARLRRMVDKAHKQLGRFVNTGVPPDHDLKILLFMKSWCDDDPDGYLKAVYKQLGPGRHKDPREIEITLGGEGEIIGTGKYQQLDILWVLECGTVWLEHLFNKHTFPDDTPPIIPISDGCTIALAGDFGTGNFDPQPSPSTNLAAAISKLKPDYTIHLGDVYYAATPGEETAKLIEVWPQGHKGSFALNSNHEMYSGGNSYFDLALGVRNSIFNLQSGHSYFALEHPNWIIVALDSAYHANKWTLYRDGLIQGEKKNNQLKFVTDLAQRGKKMIMLTHHNPITIGGDPTTKLFSQVMSAFPSGTAPAYWYFGHEHVGAAYLPLPAPYDGMRCRCVGHSALPWGRSSELASSKQVEWYEKRNAGDPSDTLRVYNGFTLLTLAGNTLTEDFYDEKGRLIPWRKRKQPGSRPRASTRRPGQGSNPKQR